MARASRSARLCACRTASAAVSGSIASSRRASCDAPRDAGSKSALQGAATDHAVAAGFGRGEFSGYFNNLRATSVFLCPLIYGRLYAWLMERGVMPGRTWWLLMVVASLVPELLHRSIRDADYAAPKPA